MSNAVDCGAVVNLSGTDIPLESYSVPAAPHTVDPFAGMVVLAVTAAFDPDTALTDLRVKLQAKDKHPKASWVDVPMARMSDTTGAIGSEQVFALAGSDFLMTTDSVLVYGGLRVVAEATGAGPCKAGDSLVVNMYLSEGG